ncbi:hypothetical protein BJV77DRAFT_1060018 [Russula vinacea]|nr:hypothetical protein BJV77DRAFT_1060018 [Russula vinacea]
MGHHDTYPDIHLRPAGLKGLFYYPYTQVVLLGFVCFSCPGLFNALNGLGGGAAFFAGSINNVLGPRMTLFLGTSITHHLSSGPTNRPFQRRQHPSNAGGFVIAAGAILGLCAGLLWTAQGSLMLAYPTEDQKGKSIGIFWSIFNLGGVVGAAVSLGRNFHSEIGFMILTGMGSLIPLFMADPDKMIRTDGTKVMTPHQPSWKTEIYGYTLLCVLTRLSYSSFPYSRLGVYRPAPRPTPIRRRARAFAAWSILLVFVSIVHIWAFFYQRTYTRQSIPPYWMMGAMSNDPARLAYFAGFYKSIQSAGAAGVWRADAMKVPYMNLFLSTWALLVAGLVFSLPMIHLRVKDHTDVECEDL